MDFGTEIRLRKAAEAVSSAAHTPGREADHKAAVGALDALARSLPDADLGYAGRRMIDMEEADAPCCVILRTVQQEYARRHGLDADDVLEMMAE